MKAKMNETTSSNKKVFEYKMPDKELDLVFQFKSMFAMDYAEYYTFKTHFLENTLQDRVHNYHLNKIFHIIIDFFEDKILHYGEFGKYFKGQSLPFEKGYKVNILADWFYDRILLVILLYLTTGRNNTILLLTKDNWQDKLSYGEDLTNVSIDAMRIPEECSTSFLITLYY